MRWLSSLPLIFRWFPLLVVCRPLIDNLYFLKNVSPFLSPPYLVGVLTPALSVLAIINYRMGKRHVIDRAMTWWAITVGISCLMLLLYDPLSLLTVEFVLKLSLPVYLYFFLRRLIRNLADLDGIMTSFLFAGCFVAALLIYELAVNPIAVEESRGLERIQAGFGDVVSYGMYTIFALISITYFFFSTHHRLALRQRLWKVLVVLVLGILVLINIHHTATYTVFLCVVLLFVLFALQLRQKSGAVLIIIALAIGFNFWGSSVVEERISPLLQTDLAVYRGEQDSDRLLHGRVGRWRMMLEAFSEESVPVQFLGYPLSMNYSYHFIGIGSHNDFFRVLFATGILGLLLYFNLLYRVGISYFRAAMAQRFLLLAALMALVFYSISVTPTFYAPFMYFILSIVAFQALESEPSQ